MALSEAGGIALDDPARWPEYVLLAQASVANAEDRREQYRLANRPQLERFARNDVEARKDLRRQWPGQYPELGDPRWAKGFHVPVPDAPRAEKVVPVGWDQPKRP